MVLLDPEQASIAATIAGVAPPGAGSPGRRAHAVGCWSGVRDSPRANLTAARRGLAHAFGSIGSHRVATPGDDPSMLVSVPRPAVGWAVATWLVTHAASY